MLSCLCPKCLERRAGKNSSYTHRFSPLQIAGQVLGEDLVLVLGQQERMLAGDDTWGMPLPYDKLAVRYRRWRNTVGVLSCCCVLFVSIAVMS